MILTKLEAPQAQVVNKDQSQASLNSKMSHDSFDSTKRIKKLQMDYPCNISNKIYERMQALQTSLSQSTLKSDSQNLLKSALTLGSKKSLNPSPMSSNMSNSRSVSSLLF